MDENRFEYRDDLSGRLASEVLDELAQAVGRAENVLLTSHVNPDGDAVGSVFALAVAVRDSTKRSVAAFSEPLPDRYAAFVPDGVEVVVGDAVGAAGPFDLCGVLDTSEPGRIGSLEKLVFSENQSRFAIDHHIHEPRGLFEPHLVVSRAASTASLVLELIRALDVALTPEIARLLWLGLSTDTGWFRFSNTTPRVLADAAAILEAGDFDPEPFFESVYGQHRMERMKILGDVLSNLRSDKDGRLVWAVVTREMLSARGVDRSELEGVIDHMKSIVGVEVVVLITEVGDEEFKLSLRGMGEADVESLARSFGGGGHRKAAGCAFSGSLLSLETALKGRL